MSLLTYMDVFPFLYGDAYDEEGFAFEFVGGVHGSSIIGRQPAMKEAVLPNRAWLVGMVAIVMNQVECNGNQGMPFLRCAPSGESSRLCTDWDSCRSAA